MGAIYNQKRFPAMPEADLKKAFQAHMQELRYDHGNDSYNGKWTSNEGLSIVRERNGAVKVFKTGNEAEDWLDENAEKRGPVLAVQVGNFGALFPVTQADRSLAERFHKLQQDLANFYPDILTRALEAKSEKKACAHCGSVIALKALVRHCEYTTSRQHLSDREQRNAAHEATGCPVCHRNLLVTPTDEKRLTRMKEVLAEQLKKLQVAKEAFDATQKSVAKGYWLLGGLSSS